MDDFKRNVLQKIFLQLKKTETLEVTYWADVHTLAIELLPRLERYFNKDAELVFSHLVNNFTEFPVNFNESGSSLAGFTRSQAQAVVIYTLNKARAQAFPNSELSDRVIIELTETIIRNSLVQD